MLWLLNLTKVDCDISMTLILNSGYFLESSRNKLFKNTNAWALLQTN